MSDRIIQPLFTPVRMGKLELPNRIVMAPLTRMRAAPPPGCGGTALCRVL